MSEWKQVVQQRLAGLKLDGAHEGEIIDELAQYVEDRYEGLRAAGVPEAEARRNALEGLNDSESLTRELRQARRWKAVEAPPHTGAPLTTVFYDLRMAVRAARNRPGFSFMVAGILALGIAGNAAVFSLFNGLFLKPLPFHDSGQLVDLDERAPRWNLDFTGVSDSDFYAWRAGNQTFDGMAFFDSFQANFSYKGAVQRVRSADVTRDLLDVLALKPALGRNFTPEEDRPHGPKVVMLGYDLWQRLFQGDRNVLGQAVEFYNRSYTVVGVLPREAVFPDKCDLWKPLQADPDAKNSSWYLNGIGRLKHGVTYQQATADLTRIHKGLIASGRKDNEFTSPVLTPLRARYLGDYRDVSKVLLAAVAVVLLIACSNIAALMLVRSSARAREIAVRTAIGASRARIVRQLLSENLVLAGLGGACGALLGRLLLRALIALLPDDTPPWISFDMDARFIVFAVAVTAAAALLFGLAPALQASRVAPNACLHESGTRTTSSRGRRAALNALVAGEIALALALLVCSGLLLRAFQQVLSTDPGFRADNVLTFGLELPDAKYPKPESRYAFYNVLLEQLRQLPGVRVAGGATALPLGGHWGNFFVAEDDPPATPGASSPVVLQIVASPGYVEAIGMTLLAGRTFNEHDGEAKDAPVAIVNESFVRLHWPDGKALNKRIRFHDPKTPWMQVIGVTRDEKHYGLDQPMKPSVLLPLRQQPPDYFNFALRTSGEPESLVTPVRRSVERMDADLPLFAVRTMAESVRRSLWARRAYSGLFGAFALLALFLAAAGIYGVISYAVAQRTAEIGIRMALGASPTEVLAAVLGGGMLVVGAGAVAGLVAALAGASLLGKLLFGVSPYDPTIYAAVSLGVGCVGLLANLFPARRAATIDPIRALRSE
ncbi:MAG TPA: ABC transporter permease [Bryobacteraceae bacterium]|nr:ABC transporter permease [Bryobacteraceae bacterium]